MLNIIDPTIVSPMFVNQCILKSESYPPKKEWNGKPLYSIKLALTINSKKPVLKNVHKNTAIVTNDISLD